MVMNEVNQQFSSKIWLILDEELCKRFYSVELPWLICFFKYQF